MTNKTKIVLMVVSLIILCGCASNQPIKSKSYNFETKALNSSIDGIDEVITLKPRIGIKQRFILLEPKNKPKGIVILFAGGNGKLLLHKDKDNWNIGNFLVRTRGLFVNNGYISAVIDSPSKRKNGMKDGFRTSNEHIIDIEAVIKYLKNNYPNQKIWLIGTSRGTESVAHLGINLKNKIDGIILTSSVTNSRKYKRGTVTLDMNLEKINVPTLIVSHKNDGCKVTPSSDSPDLYHMLNNKINKKLVYVKGGYEEGKPCKGKSHHGFLGIENDVVDIITNFIDKN
jgi:predicted esterase